MGKKVVWLVPEAHGTIYSYSKALWPYVSAELQKYGFDSLDPVTSAAELRDDSGVAVIHIQHEYALFGRKVPFFNTFPALIRELRERFPKAKIVATAHTVLSYDFKYPGGSGLLKTLGAGLANLLVPFLRHGWNQGTWGLLDGVIVHSGYQQPIVSGCGVKTALIPHFVPTISHEAVTSSPKGTKPVVVVLGYVSPEKGQDVAIEAFARLSIDAELWIAGGVRRIEDESYYRRSVKRAKALNLDGRIKFMGFIPEEQLNFVYASASLILAPFRESSGSGSLVEALARKVPVLASDLLLNREICEREQDALFCFKAMDAKDCAKQIERLLGDKALRKRLQEGAERYSKLNSPQIIASKHAEFYNSFKL